MPKTVDGLFLHFERKFLVYVVVLRVVTPFVALFDPALGVLAPCLIFLTQWLHLQVFGLPNGGTVRKRSARMLNGLERIPKIV